MPFLPVAVRADGSYIPSGGQGSEEYGIWLVVEVGTQYWLYPGSAVPYNCVL